MFEGFAEFDIFTEETAIYGGKGGAVGRCFSCMGFPKLTSCGMQRRPDSPNTLQSWRLK